MFSGDNLRSTGLTLAPRTVTPGLVMLKVPEIRATLSISSFWHFRMRLASLDIFRPQVELLSGGGSTWDPEEVLKALKVSLRIEAASVRIQEGLLKVNNHASPFNLSLQDFDCEIRYSNELPSYKIHLAYEHSRIFWEQRNVVVDSLEEAWIFLSGGSRFKFLKFRYNSSLLTGSGSIKDWKEPVLLLHAAGLYDARDLILAHPSINEGYGTLGILADIRNDREGVSAKGRFSSRAGGYRRMTFHDFAASLK